MEMTIESIDPIKASDLLENVGDNRQVSEGRVKTYSRQMLDGEWSLTGEPIIIDKAGRLADGQHRLWAVIESGVTIESAVVRGVEPNMFRYMNTGKSRNAADILHIEGYVDAPNLAAAARLLIVYEAGGSFKNLWKGRMPQPSEILDWVDKNSGIVDELKAAEKVSKRVGGKGFTKSLVAALRMILKRIDEEDCEVFFERLQTGLFTEPDDPIYMLRERLMKNNSGHVRELNKNEIAAITFKAWNAWRAGDGIRQLKWNGGGATPEPFPTPQ